MTLQLDDMYRDLILDHYEHPRNCRQVDDPTAGEDGHNPLCGDNVEIKVKADDGKLATLSVCTKGCAICTASGSIMSGVLKNKSVEEAKELVQLMKGYLKGERELPDTVTSTELKALHGVRKFPVRIKCALLPWTTLELILNKLG